jgi:hypothetical protein
MVGMRWLSALSSGAGAAALAIACGGEPFTIGLSGDDATATDAVVDVALEVGPEDASGDVSDARAADVHDAVVADAPLAFDAPARDAFTDAPVHCGGACAPSVPGGWTGPFELYAGSSPSPMCGASFAGGTLDANAGLVAQPAACACTCDVAKGVQCSAPTTTFYASSTTCPLSSCFAVSLLDRACTTVDVTTACLLGVGGSFVSVPAPAPSLGSCTPVATVASPSLVWATNVRACGASVAPARADCAAGNVCVPVPSSPFQASVCIEQTGDVACPLTGYTAKYVYYGGVDDTRTCSTCSCGPVLGASCTGSITQFQSTDGGCTTAQTIYNLPLACAPLQQPSDLLLTLTASGGACKATPSAPTGSATPTMPMTFCCTP